MMDKKKRAALIAAILASQENGETYASIAARFGVHRQTVQRITRKELGIPERQHGRPPGFKGKRHPKEQEIKAAILKAQKTDETYASICRRFKISHTVVISYRKELGIKQRPPGVRGRTP